MLARPAAIAAQDIPVDLYPVIAAIAGVARDLSRTIARGALGPALGRDIGEGGGGDTQRALDIVADAAFFEALQDTGLRWYASEEREDVAGMDASGGLALAIDPLDGSSNIDVNVSIGTIFSLRPAQENPQTTFLERGDTQIAAGYVIYGPQTSLVLGVGDGVRLYVLDPATDGFVLARRDVTVPPVAREFAINASNYRHWQKPVRAYIDDCLTGADGPRRADYNMRWIASLVAEAHRILMRGGVFLYPADARDGYRKGRLRMVYEAAPIAFLMEAAGGLASDGCERILSAPAASLHARTPLVFGSAENVQQIGIYHDLPESEVSALFGIRGLFRA